MEIKEIKSLTGIRGIAALYVVFFHIFLIGEQKSMPSGLWRHFVDHGYLAVDLFFILSGFVLTLNSTRNFKDGVTIANFKKFMSKRFARLYPAYVIILIISFVFIKDFHSIAISAVSSFFLLSIFSPQPQISGVLWSLSVEWVIYLFFPFWIWAVSFLKGRLKIAMLFLIFLTSYGLLYYQFSDSYLVVGRVSFPYALFRGIGSYALGIMIFHINFSKKYYWMSDVLFTAIVACLCIYKLDILIVFLYAMLIKNLSVEEKSFFSRYCSGAVGYWLGLISYSLYLIHIPVLSLMKTSFPGFKQSNHGLFVLVSLAVLLLLSTLYHKFIELPLSSYFRKKMTKSEKPNLAQLD